MNLKFDENTFDKMVELANSRKELFMKTEIVDGVEVVIFSYNVVFSDSFSTELEKEFRGTTFRKDTKECICRPFPKFFNVGERPESSFDKIDWPNAEFFYKHDGSMITPVLINDKIFMKSKSTFYSDVAIAAQKMADAFFDFFGYNYYECKPGYTSIYEYVGPNNRIVLPYQKEELIYLGSRNIKNGTYYPAYTLQDNVNYEEIKDKENIEGYVIFDGKNLVKKKTQWYVNLHRIVTDYSPVKIAELVLEEKIDDALAVLYDLNFQEKIDEVNKINDEVLNIKLNTESFIDTLYNTIYKEGIDRKEFALKVNKEVIDEYKKFMFLKLDRKSIDAMLNKLVLEIFKTRTDE